MPDRVVSSSKLTAIANAIRTKAGTQSSMTLDEMPTAIANIPGGGGTIDLTGYSGQSWNAAVAPRLDTSGMTDMSYMFYYQRTAPSIDVSNFDTSDVTNMSYMFYFCQNITSIDLGSFDTSNVINMSYMFYACYKLSSINNISSITTTNVTNMNSMFRALARDAAAPASLDLSTFRTSSVTNMGYAFYGVNLQSLDLDNWNTSNVTTMDHMFGGDSSSTSSLDKIWVPSTFVATSVATATQKPFYYAPSIPVHVYTDATDAASQGWGTIHANFIMHYNTTHQDFLNDTGHTVAIVIPEGVTHSGGTLIQRVTGSITSITLSPQDTYRIDQSSGTYNGISVTVNGNNRIISGTPTGNVILNFTATQNADVLTSEQKNFANWTKAASGYNQGFKLDSRTSSSTIYWDLDTSGYRNEGCYYDLSSLPTNTSYQFSLTYKAEVTSTWGIDGNKIGISSSKSNDYINSNMIGAISIPVSQSEYITETINITRPSTASNCYLVIVNTNYKQSGNGFYSGRIYVKSMTLREI